MQVDVTEDGADYRSLGHTYARREPLIEALLNTLSNFAGEYSFVTVPELLDRGRPIRRIWFEPPDSEWLARLHVPPVSE
jgi:hypothetical protein